MTGTVSAPVETETSQRVLPNLSRKDLRELRRPWIYDLQMVTKIASDRLVRRLGEEGLNSATIVRRSGKKQDKVVGSYAIWPLNKAGTLVIVPEIYKLAWQETDSDTYVLAHFKEVVRHYITKKTVVDIGQESGELTAIRAELDYLATPDNC